MKKISLRSFILGNLLGLIAFTLFLPLPTFAQSGYGWNWDISNFNTAVKLETNGSMLVTETITADFSREEHRGIARDIPINYRDKWGNNLNLRVQVVKVEDEQGKPWKYTTSNQGEYLELQIMDPAVYYNKPVTFVITYQVERAISYFDDHDEIYWNATGNEWDVPIEKSSGSITLPASVKKEDLKAVCYTGSFGSSAQNCTFNIEGSTIQYQTNSVLNPQENLTMVAGFPKNLITPPSFLQKLSWFLADNWGYTIPIVVFGVLYYLWYTRGRDPATNRDTIMPLYKAPDGLTPAEAGTVIDERVDMRDISASIIDLAVRGYLKIVEKKSKMLFFNKTDYTFEKLKNFDTDKDLKDHEKKLLNGIFSGGMSRDLSDLKNEFYRVLPGIKTSIYQETVSNGYFSTSPETTRNLYRGIGVGMIGLSIFGFSYFLFFSLSIALGLAFSGVIVVLFSKFMPAKTKKGVDMYYQIKGLEEFIKTAEADRIKFQEKENIFEKLLPYAMAFDIAEKWSKAFEGILKTPPSWYQSADPNFMHSFSTYYFLNSLNSLTTNMNTTFQSSPRSSGMGAWGGGSGFGGGFSGGGFGGGGGRAL